MSGSITGTVTDQDGAVIPGAQVILSPGSDVQPRTAVVDSDGRFAFFVITPGPFRLTVSAHGFSTRQISGQLQAGQNYEAPAIALPVATTIVVDAISQSELAEEQIRAEEKQRVLGFIPNFYVTYEPHPVPLDARQKFELAWKSSFDPVNFGLTAAIAGAQQAQNEFEDFGQGATGYAKRYAASYATFFTSSMLGNAVLPVLFKQDPRYFYKGTGSKRSRFLYAVANAVICKGDNGKWQPAYSSILGSLAAGGISNLYYPPANRDGVGLTFEDTGLGIAGSAAANVFQEFIVRRLTPHLHTSGH